MIEEIIQPSGLLPLALLGKFERELKKHQHKARDMQATMVAIELQ